MEHEIGKEELISQGIRDGLGYLSIIKMQRIKIQNFGYR